MERTSTIERVLAQLEEEQWCETHQDLFRFFCINVFLGQWELARTAIAPLLKNVDTQSKNVDPQNRSCKTEKFPEMLYRVCQYPFPQSLGSKTVPTPHHLSSLCLQELKQNCKAFCSKEAEHINKLWKDIDFRLLLTRFPDVADSVIKELYVFFQKHILGRKIEISELHPDIDFLTTTTSNALHSVILTDPCLGECVIKSLMTNQDTPESKNDLLQGIFLKSMNTLLDKMENEMGIAASTRNGETSTPEKVLEILSFYDPLPYWNYLDLRQLLSRLVKLATQESSSVEHLTIESIISVLCGRSTPYLLDEFSKVYFELSSLASFHACPAELNDLGEHQKQSLQLLSSIDRNICWRDFFISCQKRHVHFLGEVLELSLALVKAEKFMELQDVLSFPDLQPLKPTVLLMGWSYCHSSTHARTLLETLWDDNVMERSYSNLTQHTVVSSKSVPPIIKPISLHGIESPFKVEGFNEMFVKICRKLAYHLDLMQWCLERTRPLLRDSESSANIHATQLLKGLDTHSVLYMLHHSTSLASLDHKEVLQILNNVSADKKDDSRRKNVTFQDEEGHEASEEPVNVEQERDVAIFRSFCALKNIMDAVSFGVENYDHNLMNPIHRKHAIRCKNLSRRFRSEKSVSSSEGEEYLSPLSEGNAMHEDEETHETEDSEDFFTLYKESVVSKLTEARDHLAHLQPVTYRLEILEDIYSLLFLTHEDFCDNVESFEIDSDPDEDENRLHSLTNSVNVSFLSEEEILCEDSVLDKQQAPKSPDRSPMTPPSQNLTSGRGLDYDEPFVDPSDKAPRTASLTLPPAASNLSVHGKESKEITHDSSVSTNSQKKIVSCSKNRLNKMNPFMRAKKSRPVGFLLNDYLVRDILHLLKDCISDLNEARFFLSKSPKQKVKKSSAAKVKESVEKALQGQVLTSVKEESLLKRVTKLTQIVNEAWWRFQLIAPAEISKEPNSILSKPVHVLDGDVSLLSTFEGQSSIGEDMDDEKRRSVGDLLQISAAQGMLPHQSNVVSQLMASPESLLVFCLIKDNLSQADQVMKLFKLTDKTPEIMEFSFMKVYRTSSSHIWDLETEPREAGGPVKLGKRSVRALAKAAAVGVASASLSQTVEELLQSSSLPPLPRPKSASTREHYPFLFTLDPLSAVLIDLLCTACRTWETSNNMINLIKAKTTICENDPNVFSVSSEENSFKTATSAFASKMRQHQIIGCYKLLGKIHALIHYGEEHSHSEMLSATSGAAFEQCPSARVGLQHHLHSGFSSFKVGTLYSLEGVLEELGKAVGKIVQNLADSTTHDSSTLTHSEDFGHRTSSPRNSLTGGSYSRRSSLVQDPSPIHQSFKELMFAMEKYVPSDGLAQILLSNKVGKTNIAPARNFLFSLYEHVKEMANLIVECEGNRQELVLNYFKTLMEGPINILGRLMFVRKMPPHRLESVAKKLSLNLTHTIVHSCCPKIPSKHAPKLVDDSNAKFVMTNGNRVYNLSEEEIKSSAIKPVTDLDTEEIKSSAIKPVTDLDTEETLDPDQTVKDILTTLMNEMQDLAHAGNAKEVFDISCAKSLLNLPQYDDITRSTKKLRQLDLTRLKSPSQLLCFYANLANLMVLQCHFSHIQEQLQFSPNCAEGKRLLDEQQDMCPVTALDYVVYFSSFSYQVGQLGIVSAFDVLTHLGRSDFPSQPRQWNSLLSYAQLDLADEDPWKIFQPPKDSRLLFAINLGCTSSPPLQVLSPETVETQLDQSLKNYLSHTTTIMVEKERVSIPELLVWHQNDFIDESCQDGNYTPLVKWISNHIDDSKQEALQHLFSLDSVHGYSENIDVTGKIELPFHVDVDKFDNRFSVAFNTFGVQVGANCTLAPKVMQTTPGGRTRRLTVSLELSGQTLGLELPTYNLTPLTLEYVKHDSLMVATMVSLVCADNLDQIEEQFADDHFNVKASSSFGSPSSKHMPESLPRTYRSMSDISLVDIRSYRYQRLTEDYPILQRHLLHYILPMAAADNPELMECQEPILKFVTNDIDEQVKLCMFSLPGSDQFVCVILDIATCLLEERKWVQILAILKTLPESTILQSVKLQSLHDFTLMCYALDRMQEPGQAPKIGNILRTFYNPFLQARTVLSLSYCMPLDLSVDLLDCSLSIVDPASGLWKALRARYDRILIFGKVITCIKELRIKLSAKNLPITSDCSEEQDCLRSLEEFTDWRRLAKASDEVSEPIIEILKRAGSFQLASDWAKLLSLPLETVKDIASSHLLYLLQLEQPDTVKAFQLLDDLCHSSNTECLSVCQSLVDSLTNPREIRFVLSFILEYLTHLLSTEDADDIRLQRIGAEALMHIPLKIRGEYNHLITCPSLILEQLLMNMKADLAGLIFEKIKMDFVEVQELKLRMTQESFNDLIGTYSKKAIEVIVVQVRDQSLTESMASNGSDGNEDNELNTKGLSADQKRGEMTGSPTLSLASHVSQEATQKQASKANNYKIFALPTQPLPQDQWVPDDAARNCMLCKVERFSMFNRRHHCRICGRVVCSACSTKVVNISGVMYRSCDECFNQFNILSQLKDQEEAEIYDQHMRENLNEPPNRMSPVNGTSPGPSDLWKIQPKMLKMSMTAAVHHVDHSWKLSPDTARNDQVRSEFYYEQAPSVSLCISMLKQHLSRLDASKMILSLCDTLSAHLVPVSPGVPNPEIDYSLIITMMNQLLFEAKLHFSNTSNTSMMGQCDLYLTRVDLLRIMVESNYQDLPTIKELTKHDSVRRLRDKLIADERLSLAMDVSTKCGLDPMGVWSAMGFTCLHKGDFAGAREKFNHCLKSPADKNQSSSSQSRLIVDIINCLDKIPSSGLTEVQMLLKNPKNVCDVNMLLIPTVGEEYKVDSISYKECMFYLRTYGSYTDHINFLRSHGYWMKAVQFSVDHHCSSEVFITSLLKPALNAGDIGRLLEQMIMLDPTLEKWALFLSTTCRFLLKNKYFYTLYQVQLFMKDFIRAAMTCISHFYQRGARSYLDLSGRLQFLFTAQQHLQMYLDPGHWGSIPHPLNPSSPKPGSSPWGSNPESAARLTMPVEEVKGHIRRVALQIEITKFLEDCLTQTGFGGASTPGPKGQQVPPTIFGQSAQRIQLVVLVLLSGNKFKSSFSLVLRIIKECHLSSTNLYTQCSRELAKQSRFEDIKSFIHGLVKEKLIDDDASDEVIGASLLMLADSHSQAKDESDFLIQLLKKDSNKINAFIMCGKLRSAYLLAVKIDSVQSVQRIAGAAQRLGQSAVQNICRKWLETHRS